METFTCPFTEPAELPLELDEDELPDECWTLPASQVALLELQPLMSHELEEFLLGFDVTRKSLPEIWTFPEFDLETEPCKLERVPRDEAELSPFSLL